MHAKSPAQGALELLHLPFVDIAAGVGVGSDIVKGWTSGRSDPTPENRKALAAFMREHAARLKTAAEVLAPIDEALDYGELRSGLFGELAVSLSVWGQYERLFLRSLADVAKLNGHAP